ncbi:FK506-binding protein 5 isoform X3 [Chrysoperla carnea]|uniref:FK506-binding protein 5 isoform X3 n=1 Tax=Chrysoperla carnea TaxID=189513 RepID=UPI001D07B547|nr:FK506-binding protein 5 isoform X3 [Chrysoperla carnea]
MEVSMQQSQCYYMSEISKKRTVSSEVIETESSEVQITHAVTEAVTESCVVRKSSAEQNSCEIITNTKAIEATSTDLTQTQTDPDVSLQDLIEAELNSRLSNNISTTSSSIEEKLCMTQSNTSIVNNGENDEDEEKSKAEENLTTNGINIDKNDLIAGNENGEQENEEYIDTDIKEKTFNFLENEKEHINQTEDPIVRINEENSVLKDDDDGNTYEIVRKIEKPSSIKDKLMLGGNDDHMALLFSQTITSPAFTPTDENFDILQAIKREENSIDEFIKNENLCRLAVANEDDNGHHPQDDLVQDISNGEISPEDEREISQDSDYSESLTRVKSTIKVQDSIQIIEQEIKNCDYICISNDDDEPIEQNISEDTIIVEKLSPSHGEDDVHRTPDLVESEIHQTPDLIKDDIHHAPNQAEEDVHQVNGDVHQVKDEVDNVQANINEVIESNGHLEESKSLNEKIEFVKDVVNSDDDEEDVEIEEECANNTNSTKLVLDLVNTSTTIQTSTTVSSETIENSNTMNNSNSNSIADNKTHLKKKKSKKSKKDHEKENISVNENNSTNNHNHKDQLYIEDDLSQVNVRNLKKTYCDQSINGSISIKKSEPIISTGISIKQLCRSFGDLTSLPDDNNPSSMPNSAVESTESSPDSRAKSMIDLRRLDLEPLYRGVSVKALRASFMNLASNNNSTNNNTILYATIERGFSWRKCQPISMYPPLIMRMQSFTQPKTKSSFSKFDALSKKTMLHVRSSDAGKAQEKFNGSTGLIEQNCKACSKQVFQMEQMKAEKAIWHKNCFRCKECNKQLNVDTYQSHEGTLYCKPHFKALFAPKVVEDTQPMKPRKPELIIRESQPVELPPDVVRASDKPDLGLEELQSLNVKERFQVFEHANEQQPDHTLERTSPSVKRSSSILSKLARFQAKGMDIGVSDDALNGIPIEPSSDESEQSDEELGEDADLIRAKRKTAQKEEPIVFDKLDDLKSRWESGNQMTKDERREECKQEIQSIRSRLFMGKQGKMKEMYQQAVAESESGANVKKSIPAAEISDTAKSIKEKFEKGEALVKDEENHKVEEDMSIFEAGISKKSRSIFKELDATSGKPPKLVPLTPVKSQSDVKRAYLPRQTSEDIVRSTDCVDDVQIQTADISNKFKFFESYQAPQTERKQFRITPPREGVVKENSPDREIYHDPDVVRSEETIEDPTVAAKTHTATKMLSIFRQLEEKNANEPVPTGPKPLKRFTPPPEPTRPDEESDDEGVTSSEEEESETEQSTDVIRAVDKPTDEFLIQAQNAARAKQLRAKFEKWEENEIRRENNSSSINLAEETSEEQIESAKTLRARFESMQETTTTTKIENKARVKVHRFVELQVNNAELCEGCGKRVYPLEKIECNTKAYHKQCFKCLQCKTVLRMDSYTLNQGMLYCIPHFKQLFIAKGNYETGFGLDQHKSKWENHQQQQPQNGHVTPAH